MSEFAAYAWARNARLERERAAAVRTLDAFIDRRATKGDRREARAALIVLADAVGEYVPATIYGWDPGTRPP